MLQTEPWLVLGVGCHLTGTIVAVVELVGSAIVIPALTHDEDIITAAEGVRKSGDGA